MRVAVHREIAVPREAVWKYIVDPDHQLEFMDGMTRWEMEGPRRTGLGARFAMRMRVGSVELGGVVEIVEFDPPCDMAWTSVTGVDHRGRWRLRHGRDGRTDVELRVTYFAPRGFIGPLADLVAWPIVRGHLQRSLQELARRVETPPTTRSVAPVARHYSARTRTARAQR
jgi:uncharacterized protein YndB with AHSA1/START domain